MPPPKHTPVDSLIARARVAKRAAERGLPMDWSPLDLLVDASLGYLPRIKPHDPDDPDDPRAGKEDFRPLEAAEQLSAIKELSNYVAPKLKSIEHKGSLEVDDPKRNALLDTLVSKLSARLPEVADDKPVRTNGANGSLHGG
jgi:hypothetical protein